MAINSRLYRAGVFFLAAAVLFTAYNFHPVVRMISPFLPCDGGETNLVHILNPNISVRIELPSAQALNTTGVIRSLMQAIPGTVPYNVTWVTALYDIGRSDRSYHYQYKQWFIETLKIPLPVIVFCRGEDAKWIGMARRGQHPTLIIGEDQIPLEVIVQTVREIIPFMRRGRTAVEWSNERYIPLQFSKAIWLQRAMELNPFRSHTFFWVDAGASRFFTGRFTLLQAASLDSDRLYISGTEYLPLVDTMPSYSIIGSQLSFFMGGVFGGRAAAVARASAALLEILHSEMLSKRRVDNEQVAFGLMYKAHRDWFHVIDRVANGCYVVCL
jgi:hypothetical protein